jgi:DNA topoisomerase I
MTNNVMVVESPNKVQTISAALGSGWTVLASAGHIRDLPRQELGIEGDEFKLVYEFVPPVPRPGKPGQFFPGGEDRVKRIAAACRQADMVYLATDLDREGEAISWHLKDTLLLSESRYQRVTFTEINGKAIRTAIASPRKIDMQLVRAQEARRTVDRIVGYILSPIISDKLGMPLSVGRVQSPAVRIVVDREREVSSFRVLEHFGALVTFAGPEWEGEWTAELDTKPFVTPDKPYLVDRRLAEQAAACRDFEVIASETAIHTEAPPSAFSTSSMLQAASIALGFDPEYTSKLAQRLFEGSPGSEHGYVTYIRTDQVNISDEAFTEIHAYGIEQGWAMVDKRRRWQAKKGAQEAHEAIRPTHINVLEAGDNDDERALYRLIWKRTMASQMAVAKYSVNTVELRACDGASDGGTRFTFKAKGRVLLDAGWRGLTATDDTDDPDDPQDDEENTWANGKVPKLVTGRAVKASEGKCLMKRTKPPSRYTKASLVKKLEACGIGRPATYASIMANIMSKSYLSEKKRFLYPTSTGTELVDTLVECGFSFMELTFTRDMEADLDRISEGDDSYLPVVKRFSDLLNGEIEVLKQRNSIAPKHPCPACQKPLRRTVKGKRIFWYCTGFKDGCKTFMDDDAGKPVPPKVHHCEKCQGELRRFQRKDQKTGAKLNQYAWRCMNDDCKTFYDDNNGKPAAKHQCPACQAELRRFQKKDKVTKKPINQYGYRCSREGCNTFLDEAYGKPLQKHACPKCSTDLRRYQKKDPETNKPIREFGWFCTNQACKTFMDDKKGTPVPQEKKPAKQDASTKEAGAPVTPKKKPSTAIQQPVSTPSSDAALDAFFG